MPLILPMRLLYHRIACSLATSEEFEAQFDERLVGRTAIVHVVGTDVGAPRLVACASEGCSLRAAFVASQGSIL